MAVKYSRFFRNELLIVEATVVPITLWYRCFGKLVNLPFIPRPYFVDLNIVFGIESCHAISDGPKLCEVIETQRRTIYEDFARGWDGNPPAA